MNDLPPLPEPVRRGPFGGIYTGTQMRAHARDCARVAVEAEREACAALADRMFNRAMNGAEIADAIRKRAQEAALQRLAELSKEMGEEL